MKNQIPEFLQEKLQFKSPKVKNYPDEIKQFIKEYGEFYNFNLGDNLTAILKLIKDNIDVIPICEYAGCNAKVSITKQGNLDKGCCRSHKLKITNLEKYGFEHNQLNPEIAEKTKKTNVERYGTANPASSVKVRQKIENTLIERFGVNNAFKSAKIKEKIKHTLHEKYGVDHPMRSESIKNKFNDTMKEKYGCEWAQQNEDILSTTKQNNIKKFGVENPMMNPEIVEKAKQTNLERYGFESAAQNENIKDKMKKTNISKYGVCNAMFSADIVEKQQKMMFSKKEYIWKTGEISIVQGYEPIVLRELEEVGYSYDDILTSPTDMPEIWYEYENDKHRYYPDIFIPKENTLIEVKSEWTLELNKDKNEAKFDAVKKLGFNFKLEVR